MKKYHIINFIGLISLFVLAFGAYAFNLPKWFPFSEENALEEWQEKIFKDKVLYVVESIDEDQGYLLARSNKACSGLIYRIKFYPSKNPMISWKWKVLKFPDKNKPLEETGEWIEKDDYAARVYVIFSSWNFFNIKSLEYVWDKDLPEETLMANPNYGNLKIFVAHSGEKDLGQWVMEERDIAKDYIKAFGHPPRRPVTAIALMTDADNTVSTAEALYKDITVGYNHEKK